MAKIRLTKRFFFESAHALHGYDGKCKNIHGHSYTLEVTIMGEPLEDEEHPKQGMVMDFGDLSKLVKTVIIDQFDHALLLNEKQKIFLPEGFLHHFERINFLPFQPTSEKLLEHFVFLLKKHLPESVQLCSIRLYETTTSFAEWNYYDNVEKS